MNFGKLICHKNKRNCKNLKLLQKYKLTSNDKKLLKKRNKVEHFFARLKTFRRINIRAKSIKILFATLKEKLILIFLFQI